MSTNVDALHYDGIIEIERIDRYTGDVKERRIEKNFITPIGKMFDTLHGPGGFLPLSGDVYGFMHIHQNIYKLHHSYPYYYDTANTALTLVLLRLGDDRFSLNENTNLINLWSKDGSLEQKIVGFANVNTATTDAKEGIITNNKTQYAMATNIRSRRWIFNDGKAEGEFDTIVMMPASYLKQARGFGMSAWMCMDQFICTDTIKLTQYIVPPGVPGFTQDDEVLVNYSYGGISKHKVNLSTGVVTDLKDTDPFISTIAGFSVCDYTVIGDYLYIVYYSVGGTTIGLDIYRLSDGYRVVSKTIASTSTNLGIGSYVGLVKFLKVDSRLFCIVSTNNSTTSGKACSFEITIDSSTGLYSNLGTVYYDHSKYAQNLPTIFGDVKRLCISNFGDRYLLYIPEYSSTTEYKFRNYKAIEFTSLSDVAGTMNFSAEYYGININTLQINNNKFKGFIRVGSDRFYSTIDAYDAEYNIGRHAVSRYVYNNAMNDRMQLDTNGLFMSKVDWHGNCYSIKVLQDPVVKSPGEILYITYGYQRV